jgi:oligosaccharyltransferase complex subunit delta (ribophorin II)
LTSALSPAVSLSGSDSLKIVLTTTEGKTGKKPHQAFLTLHEPTTGLEESFPFILKDNGKGKVEVVRSHRLIDLVELG